MMHVMSLNACVRGKFMLIVVLCLCSLSMITRRKRLGCARVAGEKTEDSIVV